ncbi:zf-TFIIB domain-containing protein [Amycolatopsis carbonis]|uniref:Zf-TFIIB domain-containing protein n=1 Tax=Amycolatopsis carbonis TaxID=715471 RepID=A0A9Y2IKD5_9PSEU|nr:zf-TFIIB domain-containing protein [Amycolatopsis sp. 2-15]WIX80208.1 zf-TFIIB domain-containing protein [Amycolatopsis sp. 2-15]
MRTVDKNGIHIEQCEACRGIFLDHGELEQIAGAESSYYGGAQSPPPRYGRADSPRPYRGGDSPRPYRGGGYSDSPKPYGGGGYSDSPRPYGGGGHRGYADSPRPHGHRKRSFLENLFD